MSINKKNNKEIYLENFQYILIGSLILVLATSLV